MIHKPEFAASLRDILIRRIEEGKLILPVLPDVAVKVERLLGDPEVDLRTVATVLEKDPVLAAQLIHSANSAAYKRAQKTESIRKAVPLLGARNVRNLLLTTVARQIFTSRVPRVNETLRLLWDHSLAVAVFSQDVAGLVELPDPDAAYLAGLLHDGGQAVVGIYLLEVERSILERWGVSRQEWIDHDLWLELVQTVYGPVSAALAEKWNLPQPVCEAISLSNDYDASARRSIGNVVRFCDALATQMGIHAGPADPQAPALIMIGRSLLGVDEDVVNRLTSIGKKLVAESGVA